MSAPYRDKFREAAKDTREMAQDFWLNTAFLAGYQWIFQNPTSMQLEERPQDDRIRMTVNRMATNHRTLLSNLMQKELTFEVPPNGADDASVHSAYVATEVLYQLHNEHNWERLRENTLIAALKGGTCAIALDWDETRDDSIETPLSIAEFVVEPGARDAERARWWIKAQLLAPKEAQAVYDLSEPPLADATNGLNPLQTKLMGVHNNEDGKNPLTLVLTYYERPNPLNEEGKFCVEINGKEVDEGPWPFPFTDRLNLVVGTETAQENHWWGRTIYSQARSPQVALNYAKSNISEHLRDASVSRMLIPHSALRIMDALDDVPGNMYPYPDGLEKPSWLSPAQLPAWLQNLAGDYKLDIDDIMGVHDVSRGTAPANLESGTAISILAEMDGSPTGRLLKEIAGMFSRLARMELQLHEEMVKNKRFAVIDTDAGPLSFGWTGKDIGGQHFARVPLDSIIPRSRAAQQQIADTMMEMGIIKNVTEYITFAEMPNRRALIQVMAPNVAKAQREHSRMAQGETVLPAKFDGHAEHIKEHNNFRLTVAYERLSPADQEKIDLHIQTHETMAAQAAALQMGRAQASPVLAEVPNADGAPPVDPAMLPEDLPPEPDPSMMAPPPEPPPADPGAMANELAAMFGG